MIPTTHITPPVPHGKGCLRFFIDAIWKERFCDKLKPGTFCDLNSGKPLISNNNIIPSLYWIEAKITRKNFDKIENAMLKEDQTERTKQIAKLRKAAAKKRTS